MIDFDTASNIAWEYIRGLRAPAGDSLVLLEEMVREEEFGWVFYYASKNYAETGDIRYLVFGNAPIIVNRNTGILTVTGTAKPIEYYIQKYREDRRNGPGRSDS